MIRSILQVLAVLTIFTSNFFVITNQVNAQGSRLRTENLNKSPNSLLEYISGQRVIGFPDSPKLNLISDEQVSFEEDQIEQVLFEDSIQLQSNPTYGWELFPDSLLYHSYMAGEKEPRFASQWLWEKDRGRVWEAALGGRWGIFRKGTPGPYGEGFQFDVEGAGLVRIDPEQDSDLEAADFRAGFIGTWKRGQYRWKCGYYHLSSHVGDEFLDNNPGFDRRNYVRDALLFGVMYDVTPELTVYGEYAYAANANGGAEPGEIQLGVEYSALRPVWLKGAPFAAINGHLREEFDFSGSVNVLAGWQWIGPRSGHSFRFGVQHYNGPSMQYSFFDQYESLTGLGIWFDY